MEAITSAQIRNVAVVGHKGVGKTALVASLLLQARAAGKPARAGDLPAHLDDSPEEKAHGATLEARVLPLEWNGTRINLIDTPGESSFSTDTRMALSAVDAAIVVLSAHSGLQSGTERVYAWAAESQLPCLFVLTHIDDETIRFDEVVAELAGKIKGRPTVLSIPLRAGATLQGVADVRSSKAYIAPEEPGARPGAVPGDVEPTVTAAHARLVDDVACTDDGLADKYLSDGDLSPDDLQAGLRAGVKAIALAPVFAASGPASSGLTPLLDGIVELLPAPGPRADVTAAAFIFKTHIDQHAGRLSFARVLAGEIHPDTQLLNPTQDAKEKIGNLLQGIAGDMKPVSKAVTGDIVAFAKLKTTRTGETLCDQGAPYTHPKPPLPPPLFERALKVNGTGGEDKLAVALQRMAEEDPGLHFGHDEVSRELVIHGMGAVHLEITNERIRRQTGLDCQLGPPKIAYRETFTRKAQNVEGKQKKQTGGHGQFGVCFIDLEPLPRGSGFVFEDAIVGGVIPRQFIPSVQKGIQKALGRGVIAGYPVVDFKVRLVDGKAHSVDSSDAAFQVAGYRAFIAAAESAKPALLEPIVKLQVTVPSEVMGDAIGDINSRRGKILGTDQVGDSTVVSAHVPLAELQDYEPRLSSMTRGKGSFTMAFDHYDVCPPMVQDKVVKESGFKPIDEE